MAHTNIKPENILLVRKKIKLTDFGITPDLTGSNLSNFEKQENKKWQAPELLDKH